MIPQEKSEAVTWALREAFGVTTFEDIRMLTKGRSGALVYRIVVGGSPFLLRIVTRTQDPTLPDHITCMRTAVEAGLAPPIRYISIPDKIAITDFVESVPFPRNEALVRMPAIPADPACTAGVPRKGAPSQHVLHVSDEQGTCSRRLHAEISGRESSPPKRKRAPFQLAPATVSGLPAYRFRYGVKS